MNHIDYETFIREFLSIFLKHREAIQVHTNSGTKSFEVAVQVHGEDHAFVVGREARMVKALHTILTHMAKERGHHAQIIIMDPQVGAPHKWAPFNPDEEWGMAKNENLIRAATRILKIIFGNSIKVIGTMSEDVSHIYMRIEMPIGLQLCDALTMVVRAIGKSMGRNVIFHVKANG